MTLVQLPGPKVTGPVEITAQSNATVHVRTGDGAHLNDTRPTVEYRGKQWIGMAWFREDPENPGTWVEHKPDGYAASFNAREVQDWRYEAPPTYRQAIVDAMAAAIPMVISIPDLLLADRQRYDMRLAEAERKLAEAQAEVDKIQAEREESLRAWAAKL